MFDEEQFYRTFGPCEDCGNPVTSHRENRFERVEDVYYDCKSFKSQKLKPTQRLESNCGIDHFFYVKECLTCNYEIWTIIDDQYFMPCS